MIHKFFQFTKDLTFPKQCFSCNSWGSFLCDSCSFTIPTIKYQRCIVCQKPSLLGLTHPKCRTKYTPERLITIFNYQQPIIQQMINTAKLAIISEIFTELTQAAISKVELTATTKDFVLCPIPLSVYKQRFRGCNQSLIIAQQLSQTFHLPIDNLLQKNNFIKQQKQLGKEQRQQNIQNAFRLINNFALPKSVLLVDDVTTTGSTFKAATKILKQAGIKQVWCFSIAQD